MTEEATGRWGSRVFVETEQDGRVEISVNSEESLEDDHEEDIPSPSSSALARQSEPVRTSAKTGASSAKRKKTTRKKRKITKNLAKAKAAVRRGKTPWTPEDKREAVSAWIYNETSREIQLE